MQERRIPRENCPTRNTPFTDVGLQDTGLPNRDSGLWGRAFSHYPGALERVAALGIDRNTPLDSSSHFEHASMTNSSFHASLFPYSALPSLTAIACFACFSLHGVHVSLHIATATATFVFC